MLKYLNTIEDSVIELYRTCHEDLDVTAMERIMYNTGETSMRQVSDPDSLWLGVYLKICNGRHC